MTQMIMVIGKLKFKSNAVLIMVPLILIPSNNRYATSGRIINMGKAIKPGFF